MVIPLASCRLGEGDFRYGQRYTEEWGTTWLPSTVATSAGQARRQQACRDREVGGGRCHPGRVDGAAHEGRRREHSVEHSVGGYTPQGSVHPGPGGNTPQGLYALGSGVGALSRRTWPCRAAGRSTEKKKREKGEGHAGDPAGQWKAVEGQGGGSSLPARRERFAFAPSPSYPIERRRKTGSTAPTFARKLTA